LSDYKNSIIKLHKKRHIVLILSTLLGIFNFHIFSQDPDTLFNHRPGFPDTDSISVPQYINGQERVIKEKTIPVPENNLSVQFPETDSLISDTLKIPGTSGKDEDISSEVFYTADDSIIISMEMGERKVFLHGNAIVRYEQIELTADYIEFNMSTNEIFAKGIPNDTSGIIEGMPEFKDAAEIINSHTIKYNFKSKKGYIETVKTRQDEGYLHAEQTRKDEFGHIHLKDGKYTTCDLDHPHFYIALTRATSIPSDKIVSGPAYLVIEDVPIPIGLPFGFFPNKKTNTSGILLPEYGEEISRGFYLRNGGYYWAVNDFMDLRFTGDIYTNSTWGARVGSMYRVRYKFNGSFNLRYYQNINGEKGLDNYSKSTDYAITWSHNQDGKANPNLQYGASVNMSTSRFDQNHSRMLTNALTNTKQSSVSFQKRWPNAPFNLTASANHSQNSRTNTVDLNLPKVSFNMNRIYPFKSKISTKDRWYEQIQLSYTSFFDNRISTIDTLLFTSRVWENMNTGFRHEIPISYNYKPKKLKNFTISPSLRYSAVAYTNFIQKRREHYTDTDTSYYYTVNDTIKRLSYAHSYVPSINFGFNPKIYGTYMFKPESRIQSIRHVMSPSASVSFIPDMSKLTPNYYRELKDESGNVLETYSIFANGMFGTPSLNRRSRTMTVALRNTLEMKVLQDTDTTSNVNKVKLLDNFDFSSSMNFDDSIKWSPISIVGNTSLLKGKLRVALRGTFDPYAVDQQFRRINKSEYSVSRKIGRLTSAGMSTGFNFASKQGADKTGSGENLEGDPGLEAPTPVDEQYDNINEEYAIGRYVDFDVPWTLSADYNLNYTNFRNERAIIQTLRFTGDFSLTPKWKIGFNTGYDIKSREITTTNLSIFRDLHCWEMRLTAVPFGIYKSFNFQINVKSAVLQDLKYNKRIPWQDRF
jgi:hypothetical protein